MLSNIDFISAAKALSDAIRPVGTETVPLESAGGRILARQVTAGCDVPPFDRSPLDGYAVKGEDTFPAPATLRVLEEIPAGHVGSRTVEPGTAVKILTGAPIPDGADAVIRYEDTEFTGTSVTLHKSCAPGSNIVRRGEDLRTGDVIAEAGQRLDAALCGSLATQDVAMPEVFRRPRAGVITTGDELTEPGTPRKAGQIINSNRYVFLSRLERDGCRAEFFGTPGDDIREIADAFRTAARTCDLIVTTGGVSVGDYDLTADALELAGGEILIRNVDLKPGGKCCFGKLGQVLVCCLSGNPASSMTCYLAVVLPAVRKLCGLRNWQGCTGRVKLLDDFSKRSPRTRLLRGRLELSEGITAMRITGEQGNSVLHTMVGCNVLAVVPAGSGPLPAGTELDAILIEEAGI